MEINRKEFVAAFKRKEKYEKMKKNARKIREKLEEKAENMTVDSIN